MVFDVGELYGILSRGKNFVISGHINPDGDAVSSCLAMALSIKMLGGNPIVLLGEHSKRYNDLAGREFIYKGDWETVSGDVFIALDCATKHRLLAAETVFDRTPVTVNIDHHISNNNFATYNYVNPNASSTCEVVYELINNSIPINLEIATALYTGIVFDTGGFRHKSTTHDTFEIAAKLVRFGIDFSKIQREIIHSHSYEEAKIFGIALKNLEMIKGTSIGVSYLTVEDMQSAKAKYSDLDNIVEYVLNTDGVEVALLFSEREDKTVKASMRSTGLNLIPIASKFGGGGHKNAAGASLECGLKEAIQAVAEEAEREMEKNE